MLRLWGSEVASKQAGEAGIFICDHLMRLADLAESWRVNGPAEHTARQQAEAEQEAAYLAALEHDTNAAWVPSDEPDYEINDDITGSLDGHDDSPRQVWLGDQCDFTYMN